MMMTWLTAPRSLSRLYTRRPLPLATFSRSTPTLTSSRSLSRSTDTRIGSEIAAYSHQTNYLVNITDLAIHS